jgi:hypothetical protein
MRIRPVLAGAAGLAAIVATAAPAAAVKYGQPDNGEHPYVGLMVAYVWDDEDEDGIMTDDELFAARQCTGTQMDADTFLTAGHCTYGADAVAIWFDEDLEPVRQGDEVRNFEDAISADNPNRADAYSYGAISHPDYDDNAFYLHDVGVVDEMIWLSEPLTEFGALPELGYWDEQIATRKKDRDTYETVGYGLQWASPDRGLSPDNPNRRGDQALWQRLKANGELIGYRTFGGGKTNDAYVVLTNNANTGGTCFGDSGGPTLIHDTNVVVAVTSFQMNATCAGTSGVYRIDTADDLAWLSSFID